MFLTTVLTKHNLFKTGNRVRSYLNGIPLLMIKTVILVHEREIQDQLPALEGKRTIYSM